MGAKDLLECAAAFLMLALAGCSSDIELTCSGQRLLLNGNEFSQGACNDAAGQSCQVSGDIETCNQGDQPYDETTRYRTDDPLHSYACSGTCGTASLSCCPAPPDKDRAAMSCDGNKLLIGGQPNSEGACLQSIGCQSVGSAWDCSEAVSLGPATLGQTAPTYVPLIKFNQEICRAQCGSTSQDCCPKSNGGPAVSSESDYTSVVVSDQIACGLHQGGTISCWGSDPNATTFCRNPDGSSFRCPSSPPGAPVGQFVTFDIATNYIDGGVGCGIDAGGQIACWNLKPGLSGDAIGLPVFPAGTYTQVALSLEVGFERTDLYACALRADQSVVCFGDITPPPGQFVEIGLDGTAICGRAASGSVACSRLGTVVESPGPYTQLGGPCMLDAAGQLTCFNQIDCGSTMPYGCFSAEMPTMHFSVIGRGCAESGITQCSGPCVVRSDGRIACQPAAASPALCPLGADAGDYVFCIP